MDNRGLFYSLPLQKVSYEVKFEKDKDPSGNTRWMKDTMDALEMMGTTYRSYNVNIRKNYAILEGKFDINDYVDVFEVYDTASLLQQQFQLPSYLKNYDTFSKAVKVIVGNYIGRPDITTVQAFDVYTQNEKIRVKNDLQRLLLRQSISEEVQKRLMQVGLDPNRVEFETEDEMQQYKAAIEQKYKEFTPSAIDQYIAYDFKTAGEQVASIILNNIKVNHNLKEHDVTELIDYIASNSCYSHLVAGSKGLEIETWNPLHIFHPINNVVVNTEDMAYVGRQYFITKTSVIDLFGDVLSEEQINAMFPEEGELARGGTSTFQNLFNTTLYPFEGFGFYQNIRNSLFNGFKEMPNETVDPFFNPQGAGGFGYAFNQGDLVMVTEAYWKSLIKVGKVILEDGTVQLVDESFEPVFKKLGFKQFKGSFYDATEPMTVTWTWITQVWKGKKLNLNTYGHSTTGDRNGIYFDIRPLEYQFRGNDIESMSDAKIPVVGGRFDTRNGNPQCILETYKPYHLHINALVNNAYQILQKNTGKMLLMGASLLRNDKGYSVENAFEAMLMEAANLSATLIDDSAANMNSLQYAMKVLDLDESDRYMKLMQSAMQLEQNGFAQIGIYPNLLQSTNASAGDKGMTSGVTQSFAVTEIYYEMFNSYRKRKLNMALEYAIWLASREKEISLSYQLPDQGLAFIKAKGDDLKMKDFGVEIVVNAEMVRQKALIDQLILTNNQSGLQMSGIIEVLRNNDILQAQKTIEAKEKENAEMQQQQEAAKRESEQQKLQQEAAIEQAKLEMEKYKTDSNNATKIRVAVLQGIANEGSYNPEADTLKQLNEQRALDLEQTQLESDSFTNKIAKANQLLDTVNRSKLENKRLQQKTQLDEKKIKAMTEKEKLRLQAVREQNENQLILDKNKTKRDEKLKEIDLKIAKITLDKKKKM